jgi:DNA-binding MarR family transcriptional regulator
MSHDPSAEPGRFAYDGLNNVLHQHARLGVLVSLTTRPEGLLFNELKQLCSLTDGNLSRHLDVLANEGFVEIHKGFKGRRPQTRVTLTKTGRSQLVAYLADLERVIHDALPAARDGPAAQPGLAPG